MKNLNSTAQLAIVALLGLIILHVVQLGALFAHLELSPPEVFGPLIGTAIAIQALAIPLLLWRHKSRSVWVIVVILTAIPSVGPHKFLMSNAFVLSPIIILGTILIAVLIAYVLNDLKRKEETGQREDRKDKAGLHTPSGHRQQNTLYVSSLGVERRT